MRVKDFALVLIVACVAQQILQVKSVKDRKREQTDGKEKRRTGVFRGRISLKDKAQCTWVATGENDGTFTLKVTCKKEAKSYNCEYVASPAACPQYASNTKNYWRQIGRSLKKQKRLCRDSTALVKAGMCRNAPDAHFRLKNKRASSRVPVPTPGPAENLLCPERTDKQKLAEEYCSRSWTSVCKFFFLMVENDEC